MIRPDHHCPPVPSTSEALSKYFFLVQSACPSQSRAVDCDPLSSTGAWQGVWCFKAHPRLLFSRQVCHLHQGAIRPLRRRGLFRLEAGRLSQV